MVKCFNLLSFITATRIRKRAYRIRQAIITKRGGGEGEVEKKEHGKANRKEQKEKKH